MTTVLTRMKEWHRPLMWMVAAMALLVVVAGVGLFVDHRQLLTESVWAKPFKFGLAFVIYGATLAWMLPRLRRARRTLWTLGTVFAVTGIVDVGFVVLQAARGTYSHFNNATDPINQVGQQIFMSGVLGLFGASLAMAVVLLFQRVENAPLTWALRGGIGIAVLGMLQGFMIAGSGSGGPRTVPDAAGNPVELGGAHGVGVPDGGGMWLTNWSVDGGDLRVPHFFGMHAVQVLLALVALLALAAGRVGWLRSERVRARLIGIAALGYLGFVALLTWQAVRGQSLIHPDATSWAALAGLIAVVTVLTTGTVLVARRRTAVPVTAAPVPAGIRS